MTDALYLADAARVLAATPGGPFVLDGQEGRHAATVKRTRPGETILVSDGEGAGVRMRVDAIQGSSLTGEVVEVVRAPEPTHTWRVIQGLAKGERADLALELMTEVGVHEVVAWQSRRSVVKWDAKADKALAKWQSTAREAAKQSRRLVVPRVHPQVVTTTALPAHLGQVGGLVLIAHEEATTTLSELVLPPAGPVTVLVGPEGGISPEELDLLTTAGATSMLISEGVLRSSTAGAVALAQLALLADLQRRTRP